MASGQELVGPSAIPTLSVSLRRPRRFSLHNLLWQDFEDLVRQLGVRLFGDALSAFKPGPDGGRDARFEGKPARWPSSRGSEPGNYVLQSKHSSKADACCSDDDFKGELRKEKRKVRKLIAAGELSHYVVFTNRAKSAADDQAFRQDFLKLEGLAKVWLVGREDMALLLTEHSDIWDRFEEEVIRRPVRFTRDDLVQIIHRFAEFVRSPRRDCPAATALQHPGLKRKNEINKISPLYFGDLQRHSMPQFEQIRVFLENPRNEEALDLYQDTAEDLRTRLRSMLAQKEIACLEEGLDVIREQFVALHPDLRRKRRWVRVFLDYMYCNCDIGQNADATQTPQA